jgi:allantoinase
MLAGMTLPTHGRYDYVPITQRAPYRWPGGAGLAVYLALNLEHFAFGEGLGAELAPGGPPPDVLNFAWRDWGNRVGGWRLLELLDELKVPASVLVNSEIYRYCPALPRAFAGRGDEIVGHGRTNSERQGTLGEEAERRLILEATEILRQETGRQPAGWLGPWISESHVTPDLLAEAGYRYLLDWCSDDQPIWMRTRGDKRILAVPYPQELNDIPAIVARKIEAAAFADMIVAQFDEMVRLAEATPLVMGIALHPYIVGQPFRLAPLRRALRHIRASPAPIWWTTSGAIAAHVASLPPGIVPGG